MEFFNWKMCLFTIFSREEKKKNNTGKRGRKKFLDEVTGLFSMPVSGGGVPCKYNKYL